MNPPPPLMLRDQEPMREVQQVQKTFVFTKQNLFSEDLEMADLGDPPVPNQDQDRQSGMTESFR